MKTKFTKIFLSPTVTLFTATNVAYTQSHNTLKEIFENGGGI